MPEQTIEETEKIHDELEKLTSIFNEEIYLRQDASSIPVTKFKIFDDMIETYHGQGQIEPVKIRIEEHVQEQAESVAARYMLGIIALIEEQVEDMSYLKMLLEIFKQNAKWTIVEHIADKILLYGDQRLALKYKAEALEKLNKNKDLKPVLEKLAKQDRKNPEIAKKYALSIISEDEEKAISYLKQAAENFARQKDYEQLEEIWPLLIEKNHDDIQFFEKVERILQSNREKARIAILLFPLVDLFKNRFEKDKEADVMDRIIFLLKKILEYEPLSQKARNELIKLYRIKYKDHSLLDDFLKISEIGNNKKPVKICINNFERNIVFDTNNYVLHRNWGVGKITSISSQSDSIIVDFQHKKDHKLSIQMAIKSLKPLKKDHIWVKYYEHKDYIVELFETDVPEFMVELLTSHENKMLVADIKAELLEKFIEKPDQWSKWWTKAKQLLKKDPRIGFNPKKKDEVLYRLKPITLSEELTEKFNALTDAKKKLDIALEALQDVSAAEEAVDTFIHFYSEEELAKDNLRKITGYLYLELASTRVNPEDVTRNIKKNQMQVILQSLSVEELVEVSASLANADVKKEYLSLIKNLYPNYTEVYVGILYEVPIKINKFVFAQLVTEEKYDYLNQFIQDVLKNNKEHSELFLWITKQILSGSWDYEWLYVSHQELALKLFRFLKPLAKIEEKGTKKKNTALDILFGSKNSVIKRVIEEAEYGNLRKIYALFKEVPYINDPEKDKLYNLITELRPDFEWEDSTSVDDDDEDDVASLIPSTGVLVTRLSYNRRKEEFDHLVNVEMPANSRDIGEAQEKGDLRENAEYKAAMEKQVQLQAAIKKMEAELKKASIIDLANVQTDRVNIGCRVKLQNLANSQEITYSILGPWDANTEENIISYQSPLGMSLLGKRVNDEAKLEFDTSHTMYQVLAISRYSH